MRVAFVDQTGGKPGGAEESLLLLLRHLPVDIEPVVVLFEDGEFAQRVRESNCPTTIVTIAAGVRELTRENPASRAIVALPSAVLRLANVFRKLHVDLVHTNSVKAHLLAAPAARLCRIPAVLHLRDMVGGVGRSALQWVARTCSAERIAISHAVATWYGLPHTTVVANPLDLAAYESLPSAADARKTLGIPLDDAPLIGIVGRINRWKGHDRFLRIAAKVNQVHPIRCAIVGEARFRDLDFVPELHTLAASLGIADRTTFIPWLASPEVAYAALDVHCNCSEREPFGRSLIEAAGAGVPSIAFNDGGAADIIRDPIDGRLIAAGDEDAFAAALLDLVEDSEARSLAGDEARRGAFRFSPISHAFTIAEILRRITTRHRT